MEFNKRAKSFIKLFIKIAVTAVCLWYVSKKIDWNKSLQTIKESDMGWLFLAMSFFVLSKVVSSLRLNNYFRNINLILSEKINLKLYWLGMFYNLFLPGGIGGDAYKVILLNRSYQYPAKQLTAAVLLDRISGVVGLAMLAAAYQYLIFKTFYSLLLLVAIVPGLLLYYFFVKKVFPSFIKSFQSTLWLGIAVQALQVFCAYCIMQSLHIYQNQNAYILIFLLSSVIAILPFTIGGLGARELVFIWGSTQLMLSKDESVSISISFYLITLFVSFAGVYWVYKNPLQQVNKSERVNVY